MQESSKKTILIIEDEANIRHFATRVLDIEGYNVLAAEDGETGLTIVADNHVDLIFMDLRLPGQDGWSVLRQVKSNKKLANIKVIMLTASAGVSMREKALDMGAMDYLVKPLSAASLKEAAAQALIK
ncbi:MAG: response regulator [Chloroflexi bacterium]|jgi:DNA-binding response OmpR family regulator|nr:response regulator [Chloroflexota bacterium]MBT7081091.1 response regulator [Chloroflexota bacterium]MBT7289472.1 response regulator [Chloroflexota bacterium]